MAQIKRTIPHGQSWDAARVNFVRGIDRAIAEHGKHFNHVEWTPDKTAAKISGPGFALNLNVDPTAVHVTGHIPFFLKFLEGPVLKSVEEFIKTSAEQGT
jgi:Putative polyhydroxyalkanoic acid system protein (PHA_gran_rgn)